jgi:hypothetical protein
VCGEFLDWYRNEHLPILLECPTWNGCRFVESPVLEGHQFYAYISSKTGARWNRKNAGGRARLPGSCA